MAKSRKGACGKPMKKSRKGGCSKTKAKSGKDDYDNNTYFATSMKAQRFICDKIKGKNVQAVGGINGALGCRLKKAGFGSASKLSCEVKKMTKRNFMRYMLKTAGGNVRHAMDAYVSTTNHCREVKDCKCGGGKSSRRRC